MKPLTPEQRAALKHFRGFAAELKRRQGGQDKDAADPAAPKQ